MPCSLAILSFSGTFPPPPEIENSCAIPEGVRLDDVIKKSKEILQGNRCNEEFDELYENILKVAEGESGPKNKALIADFINWCYDNRILNKNTARQKYGEYFSSEFMCSEKWPKICHQCPRLNEIEKEMAAELKKKEQGLLRICEDEPKYNKALTAMNQAMLVLKAACMACSD